MKKDVLLGLWKHLISIPRFIWRELDKKIVEEVGHRRDFMTPQHSLVHHFVVRELPRYARPMPPGYVAEQLALPLPQVVSILDDLEKHLTFLYRDANGAVEWAYPVTVAKTPHHLKFKSGESLYAAWAEDAIAAPFVQGHLRNEYLVVEVETACGHCGKPIHLEIDSECKVRVLTPEAQPLIFMPNVDFDHLEDPSIIDKYWRQSVFFWSEEHISMERKQKAGVTGVYLSMNEAAHVIPPAQSSLFGFKHPGERKAHG